MRDLPAESLFFAAAAIMAVLLLGPLAVAVPFPVQIAMLTAAVVFLGLPHGALDPWIARRAGLYRGMLGLAGFNLVYLGLAGLVVLGWWASPVLALALFLVLSGWHFAGDWQGQLDRWQCFIAAVALLSMPAVFHLAAVEQIFIALSGGDAVLLAKTLAAVAYVATPALLVVIVAALMRRRYAPVVELACLLLLAASVPPLVYFTVYFCLLHSPRHMRATLAPATSQERLRLLFVATVYTLASIILGALTAVFLIPGTDLSQLALQLVFIGLAALTVPHMVLIMLARPGDHSRLTT